MVATEESRVHEIAEKLNASNEYHNVRWQNQNLALQVITISLDSIVLNPRSHRIRSQSESEPTATLLEENPFSEEAQEIIATFLRDTNRFDDLKANLKQDGQLDNGVITRNGVVINGNTRAVALRELGERYINVAVLPKGATDREIDELEARLQLTREYKQDYTLTNELLFIQEQLDRGTERADLAILLGKAPSRNKRHLEKGVKEIDKSVRILQHIREIQDMSGETIPLVFFDPHDSALSEADSMYMGLRDKAPAEARSVRNGRMAAMLVEVPYRHHRKWDQTFFQDYLQDYLNEQAEDKAKLISLANQLEQGQKQGESEELGVGWLKERGGEESDSAGFNPTSMLRLAAKSFATPRDQEVAPGFTKENIYDSLRESIIDAAEEKAEDEKDKRRVTTPIDLVRRATTALVKAHAALVKAKGEEGFKPGKLRFEVKKARQALDKVAKAND